MRRLVPLLLLAVVACTHVQRTSSSECGAASLLSGDVVGRNGAPKAHVRLLLSAAESDISTPAQTDAAGKFSFGCVGPADYQISIGTHSEPVHVGRGEHVEVHLRVW